MTDDNLDPSNPYAAPPTPAGEERYDVGDPVVVIASVPLRDPPPDGGECGYVYPGMQLRVAEVRGNWLGVDHGVRGWIEEQHVIPADESLDYFKLAVARHFGSDEWLNGMAHVFRDQGHLPLAVAGYTGSIRRAPADSVRWQWRAWARASQGDYGGALSDCRQALQLDPVSAYGHNMMAWILATCPVDAGRNGQLALEHAQRAVELAGADATFQCSLACAYAELGRFDEAIPCLTKAMQQAESEDQADYQEYLKLLRRRLPCRYDWRQKYIERYVPLDGPAKFL